MKVQNTNTSIVSKSLGSCRQTISAANASKATFLLRDKIYTDKRKAALYETLANAIDEHKKYNVERPVEVYLSKSELCIRDYGNGLSDEAVMQIFFQYFESTKSEDNVYNGGFGIGAKAPGAYSDVYHVESYYDGKRTMFSSVVNGMESNVHKMSVVNTLEPSGICVRIPLVSSQDFDKFCKLINDAYIQTGLYSENSPMEAYMYASEMPFDSMILQSNKTSQTTTTPHLANQRIVRLAYFTHTENNMCYMPKSRVLMTNRKSYYTPTTISSRIDHPERLTVAATGKTAEAMLAARPTFESDFFQRNYVFAHDGDFLYPAQISDSAFRSIVQTVQNKYSKTSVSYFLNDVLLRTMFIIAFERGELPISPTRESVEITDRVNAWIQNKIEQALYEYIELATDSKIFPTLPDVNRAYPDIPLHDKVCAVRDIHKFAAGGMDGSPELFDGIKLVTATSVQDKDDVVLTQLPVYTYSRQSNGSFTQKAYRLDDISSHTRCDMTCEPTRVTYRLLSPGRITYLVGECVDSAGKPISAASVLWRRTVLDPLESRQSLVLIPTKLEKAFREKFTTSDGQLLIPEKAIKYWNDLLPEYNKKVKERREELKLKRAESDNKTASRAVNKDYINMFGDTVRLLKYADGKPRKVLVYKPGTKDNRSAFACLVQRLIFSGLDRSMQYKAMCCLFNVVGIIKYTNKPTLNALEKEAEVQLLDCDDSNEIIAMLTRKIYEFFSAHDAYAIPWSPKYASRHRWESNVLNTLWGWLANNTSKKTGVIDANYVLVPSNPPADSYAVDELIRASSSIKMKLDKTLLLKVSTEEEYDKLCAAIIASLYNLHRQYYGIPVLRKLFVPEQSAQSSGVTGTYACPNSMLEEAEKLLASKLDEDPVKYMELFTNATWAGGEYDTHPYREISQVSVKMRDKIMEVSRVKFDSTVRLREEAAFDIISKLSYNKIATIAAECITVSAPKNNK